MKFTETARHILLACTVTAMALMTSACGITGLSRGTPVFRAEEKSETEITVFAENAETGSEISTDYIELDEGEGMKIVSDLSHGSVEVNVYEIEENHLTGEQYIASESPVLFASLRRNDSVSAFPMPPGEYVIKAECTEKATGEVGITLMKQP